MKPAASLEPGCGCRLELRGGRWRRVRTCGPGTCHQKLHEPVRTLVGAIRVREAVPRGPSRDPRWGRR